MMNVNKLSILDACTDGDIDRFHKLVHHGYDQLNIFFKLCKNNEDKIDDVKCHDVDENNLSCEVICIKDKSDIELLLSEDTRPQDVTVKEVDGGFIVNISTSK